VTCRVEDAHLGRLDDRQAGDPILKPTISGGERQRIADAQMTNRPEDTVAMSGDSDIARWPKNSFHRRRSASRVRAFTQSDCSEIHKSLAAECSSFADRHQIHQIHRIHQVPRIHLVSPARIVSISGFLSLFKSLGGVGFALPRAGRTRDDVAADGHSTLGSPTPPRTRALIFGTYSHRRVAPLPRST
jgi:hypothetical protein